MAIVDLSGRESDAAVLALIAEAQIHRPRADAVERAPRIAAEYATDPRFQLWGLELEGGNRRDRRY